MKEAKKTDASKGPRDEELNHRALSVSAFEGETLDARALEEASRSTSLGSFRPLNRMEFPQSGEYNLATVKLVGHKQDTKMSLRQRKVEQKSSTLVSEARAANGQQVFAARKKVARMLIDIGQPQGSISRESSGWRSCEKSGHLGEGQVRLMWKNWAEKPLEENKSATSLNGQAHKEEEQERKRQGLKIYSIFNPKMMISFVTVLFGLFTLASVCLMSLSLSSKSSPMLVSAQYPISRESVSRVLSAASKQATSVAPKSHQDTQAQEFGQSIDRLDSGRSSENGEQIRPPLLRAPTTLAPLPASSPTGSDRDQGQRPAATQPEGAYLSPEERRQFMQNQESHYENGGPSGEAGPPGDQQQAPLGEPSAQADQSQGPPTQPEGSTVAERKSSAAEGGPSDEPETDYEADAGEDEAPSASPSETSAQDNKAAGPNTNQEEYAPAFQQQQQQAGSQAAPLEPSSVEGGSNELNGDDYNGGSDEAYFARRPPSSGGNGNRRGNGNGQVEQQDNGQQQRERPQLGAQLSLAASYNQQQSNPMAANASAYTNQSPNQAGNQEGEEAAGFGPGPNEAYLAEQAELGGELGPEAGGPEGEAEGGEQADLEEELPEQQQQQQAAGSSAHMDERRSSAQRSQRPAALPAGGRPEGQAAAAAQDGQQESEAEGAGTSGEASTGALTLAAWGAQTGGPKWDASLDSARRTGRVGAAQAQVGQAPSRSTSGDDMLRKANAASWQEARVRQNPHLMAMLNQLNRHNPRPQATTTSAPYNPQNNPSHAGKYFIN